MAGKKGGGGGTGWGFTGMWANHNWWNVPGDPDLGFLPLDDYQPWLWYYCSWIASKDTKIHYWHWNVCEFLESRKVKMYASWKLHGLLCVVLRHSSPYILILVANLSLFFSQTISVTLVILCPLWFEMKYLDANVSKQLSGLLTCWDSHRMDQ